MNRYRSTICLALTALAVVLFVRPATAGEQIPFNGTLSGDVTHTPVDAQTDAVLVEATGTATQIGQFAMVSAHHINTVARTAAGTFVFTAASGDKVYADFTGRGQPAAPGFVAVVETATITGGTGRFAGASGSFIVQRLYDRAAGTTTGSFQGTINSPGAAKE